MPGITRVRPGGWGEEEVLTHEEATALDVNTNTIGITVYEDGVFRIRTVTLASDLRALSVHEHGDFCHVEDIDLFRYTSESFADDDGRSVLKPNLIAPGDPGRWHAANRPSRNLANGIVGLDSDARIPAGVAKFGAVYRDFNRITHPNWSRSGTSGTLSGTTIVLPTLSKNGDRLIVRYDLAGVDFPATPGDDEGNFRIAYSVNGGLFTNLGPAYGLKTGTNSYTIPVHVMACVELTGMPAGLNAITVRLDAGTISGATMSGLADTISYDIELIRP